MPVLVQPVTRRTLLLGAGLGGAMLLGPRVFAQPRVAGTDADLRQIIAAGAGRGPILIPAGTFRIGNRGTRQPCLELPPGTELRGAGRDRTILVVEDGTWGHAIDAHGGSVTVTDLTVDGNAARRPGMLGHTFRAEGANIRVERVRLLNSPTYGMGLGEKTFAEAVLVSDVVIENSGADGIDIKNRDGGTADIVIQNVTVTGFAANPATENPEHAAKPRPYGEPARARGKAGVDLRGKCTVRGLVINGVGPDNDGLRFRQGEVGSFNGAGAHGSTASGVTVRDVGPHGGAAITVMAREVGVDGFAVSGAGVGLHVGAGDATIANGATSRSSRCALLMNASADGTPDRLRLENVSFTGEHAFETDAGDVLFEQCRFQSCRGPGRAALARRPNVRLADCSFDASCG